MYLAFNKIRVKVLFGYCHLLSPAKKVTEGDSKVIDDLAITICISMINVQKVTVKVVFKHFSEDNMFASLGCHSEFTLLKPGVYPTQTSSLPY